MLEQNTVTRNTFSLKSIARKFVSMPPAIWMVALMVVYFALNTKNYLTVRNLVTIAVQCAPLFVVACGQTLIVLLQGTDLSLGASVSMVTVVWVLLMQSQVNPVLAMLIAIVCAVLAGVLNGIVVTKLKLPIFIATLGMANILSSIALTLSDGSSVYQATDLFKIIANKTILGLPVILWIAIACFLLTWALLNRTRFGSRVRALGGNPEALNFAGYSIDKATIQVFAFTSLMAGIAGIMLASRIESGNPIAGSGFEFNSVAAVLLGGTSMREGRGSIVGTVFGVLLIQILKNGLVMMSVSSIFQSAIIGIVVLLAIILDAYLKQKQEEQ